MPRSESTFTGHTAPSGQNRKHIWCTFSKCLSQGALLLVLFGLSAAIGVSTALLRIPRDRLAPPSWAPVGQTLSVVTDRAVAFPSQRELIDYLFAYSAGISPESLPFFQNAQILRQGTPLRVLKADLDYLLVELHYPAKRLWIEARALGIHPPGGKRFKE